MQRIIKSECEKWCKECTAFDWSTCENKYSIVDLDKHLDSFGPIGSMSRLKEIARLDLGVRSEAAKKVIAARQKIIQQKIKN